MSRIGVELLLERGATGSWQLRRKDQKPYLPGQPWIQLDSDDFAQYLREEHLTKELDRMVPFIRMFGVATPTWNHISSLHHQAAHRRTVVPTENPKLHLVWYHDLIFVKPIPEYMLSLPFWTFLRNTDPELLKACTGFMRTYSRLFRYETDFKQHSDLLPTRDGKAIVDFDEIVEFLQPFASVGDDEVSPRFTFGELRLSRLNWLTRIVLGKATYHHIHDQWRTYFHLLLAPFLALFAILSTVLSAMQVGLAAGERGHWKVFTKVSRWFAVSFLIVVLLLLTLYGVFVLFMIVSDFVFAKRMQHHNKKPTEQQKRPMIKSGVV